MQIGVEMPKFALILRYIFNNQRIYLQDNEKQGFAKKSASPICCEESFSKKRFLENHRLCWWFQKALAMHRKTYPPLV